MTFGWRAYGWRRSTYCQFRTSNHAVQALTLVSISRETYKWWIKKKFVHVHPMPNPIS
jgi:hypothetical protein